MHHLGLLGRIPAEPHHTIARIAMWGIKSVRITPNPQRDGRPGRGECEWECKDGCGGVRGGGGEVVRG